MIKIKINLKNNSYYIFLQHNIFDNIVMFHEKYYSDCKAIIITDQNVKKYYLKKLTNRFSFKNIKIKTYSVLDGENSKSFKTLEALAEKIIKKGINRNDIIYAFGGGVVGDLTGFLSSIVLRGVKFIQIPTTLLSQVDSSVGGKTAINSKLGKNLIGTFFQPSAVFIDPNTLNTLPRKELLAGYAEVVKYGLINDRDYKELAQNLASASLDADELSVNIIINGLYMNGVSIIDILDYVVDVAGHIIENQLKSNQISHAEVYFSRNIITRSVDSLNKDKPNGSFNGKNALCVNFEDNLPDIGVVMSEVLLRHKGYNVYNTGSHAELGSLKNIIKDRKIELLLFYLCNLQCCNAVIKKNIEKTKIQIFEIVALAKKAKVKVIFGGEGLLLLKGVEDQFSGSFLTYSDLSRIL